MMFDDVNVIHFSAGKKPWMPLEWCWTTQCKEQKMADYIGLWDSVLQPAVKNWFTIWNLVGS